MLLKVAKILCESVLKNFYSCLILQRQGTPAVMFLSTEWHVVLTLTCEKNFFLIWFVLLLCLVDKKKD